MHDLAHALDYLHKNSMIHRDIKCPNILIGENNVLKIGDLGLAILQKNEGNIEFAGTSAYFAPEIVKEQKFDNKIDIWGLGCVIYYLMCFEHPFYDKDYLTMQKNILQKEIQLSNYSEDLCKIVEKLLCKNPLERPDTEEILYEIHTKCQKFIFCDNLCVLPIKKPKKQLLTNCSKYKIIKRNIINTEFKRIKKNYNRSKSTIKDDNLIIKPIINFHIKKKSENITQYTGFFFGEHFGKNKRNNSIVHNTYENNKNEKMQMSNLYEKSLIAPLQKMANFELKSLNDKARYKENYNNKKYVVMDIKNLKKGAENSKISLPPLKFSPIRAEPNEIYIPNTEKSKFESFSFEKKLHYNIANLNQQKLTVFDLS